MGKKKRQNQNSNNAVNHADSSESESSKDSTQNSEATKTICPHISKSVEMTNLRKNIKISKDKNTHLVCLSCKKADSVPCKSGWVCLRCGSFDCGPDENDHRLNHHKTPRSDSHCLAFQINTNIIWCFSCSREIPIDVNKKVQSSIDLIKKQYNDDLPFNAMRVDTDSTNMNGNDSVNYLKQETQSCQPTQKTSQNNKDSTSPIFNLPRVRGLRNLGNTCFFNSVLQCLAQTPELVELLREMDIPGEKFHIELDGIIIDSELGTLKALKPPSLSEALAQILTEVSGSEQVGDSRKELYIVNPGSLLSALTSKCPQFEGGDQHDAHELLRHLLDTVHTEDLQRYQKVILKHVGYTKNLEELDEVKKTFAKKVNQKVCDTIPIRPDQVFKGSLVSILQCSVCSHVSKREEPFLDLSLPVAQEKALPPTVRKKHNCNSPFEEEKNTEGTMSKHQMKKEKRMARRNHKTKNGPKKDQNQGEPTIEEEDKKDSVDGEQSDADVEDNEDNVCEEQDHKTEIVESGYSSEKQMSPRGSPVTTQSPEEESKCDFKLKVQEYPGCESNPVLNKPLRDPSACTPEVVLTKEGESGMGSIQELSVTIPEETNTECTSQDSVRVNASNGSPEISSDSRRRSFKTGDLASSDYKLPKCLESEVDRTTMVYDWNCTGDPTKESSSVRLSISPQYGSMSSQDNIINISPKCSPKESPTSGSHSNDNMSVCTSLPNSNDNMSVCNSLPENVSTILNSPIKSENFQKEENSGSEERPESRMECRKNRSSPVELGEVTELDSGLLKLSLEGMTCADNVEDTDGAEEVTGPGTAELAEPVYNPEAQNGFVLVGGITVNKSIVPSPPPLPLFTSSYSFSHPEPPVQKFTSTFPRHKIEEGEFSLHSCLSQFTMLEMLAGNNKVGCDACTEKLNKGNKEGGKTVYQNSSKQLLISKLPKIMIFHLKRFQVQRCSFRKISRHVEFPLVLDVSEFCYLNNNKEPILYSLYGVVEHSGHLHGGHYVAYVKVRSRSEKQPGASPPGKWYYISDSRVSDIDESSVLKTQAYLLFYERI